MPSAEAAYTFRHALLRDAAYQLHLPTERAELHAQALVIIESLYGGRAPAPPPLDNNQTTPLASSAIDVMAHELASHAKSALEFGNETMKPLLALYLRRLAESAKRQFQHGLAIDAWLSLAEVLGGEQKAQAISFAADSAQDAGQSFHAQMLSERALAEFRRVRCRHGEGVELANLGAILRASGKFEQAVAHLREALKIHEEVDNRAAEGTTWGNMGAAMQQLGKVEEAERAYRKALEITRSLDKRDEAGLLANFAGLYHECGRFEEAETLHRHALAIAQKNDDRRLEGAVLSNMGLTVRSLERNAEAEAIFLTSLSICREVGNRRTEGIVLGYIALCHRQNQENALAHNAIDRALAIHREVGNRRFEGNELGSLAALLLSEGETERAEAAYREAVAIHRQTRNRRFEGAHLRGLAMCLRLLDREDEAIKAWNLGSEILAEIGNQRELDKTYDEMRTLMDREKAEYFPP